MNKPLKQYAGWNKPSTNAYILYCTVRMKFPEKAKLKRALRLGKIDCKWHWGNFCGIWKLFLNWISKICTKFYTFAKKKILNYILTVGEFYGICYISIKLFLKPKNTHTCNQLCNLYTISSICLFCNHIKITYFIKIENKYGEN